MIGQRQTTMPSGFHFLVVDDVPLMRRIAIKSLNTLGYTEVSEAEDGEQALKLLRTTEAPATPINFILTDWSMPVMDGMALLRTVRASAELKHLPVLVVSAHAEDAGAAVAARNGADGYIIKPLKAGTLIAALDGVLAKRGWGTDGTPR